MSANDETKRAGIPASPSSQNTERSGPPDAPLFVQTHQNVWDICDEIALDTDRKLVAQWNNTLQTVIVSAALYLAVVTPFVIETMNQIPGDQAKTTRDILLVISRQLANTSTPQYESTPDENSGYSVFSGLCFLLSTLCSLIAAVFALLASHWVAAYDLGVKGYTTQDRVIKRVLRDFRRRKQVVHWFIETLPLGLIVSLGFFLLGFLGWISSITGYYYILWAGIPPVMVFYLILLTGYSFVGPHMFNGEPGRWDAITLFLTKWSEYLSHRICSWFTIDSKWAAKRQSNFRSRRERGLEESISVYTPMKSLLWLAHPTSSNSNLRDILLNVLQEITELPASIFMKSSFPSWIVPWEDLFIFLCKPYFGKRDSREYTEKELESAAFLCRALSITTKPVSNREIKSFVRLLQTETNKGISASAYLADYSQSWHSSRTEGLQMLETGFIHTCEARELLPPNYFDFSLLKIRQAQKRSTDVPSMAMITALASTCSIPRPNLYTDLLVHLISVESLHLICEIIASLRGRIGAWRRTAIRQYLTVMESLNPGEQEEPYRELFYGILDQIIARISRINIEDTSFQDKLDPSLDLLSSILDPPFTLLRSEDLTDIFSAVVRFPASHVPVKEILYLVLEARRAINKESSLQVVTISMFKELMDRSDLAKDHRKLALRSLYHVLQDMSPSLSELGEAEQATLTEIDSPAIALILSFYLPQERTFSAFKPFTDEVLSEELLERLALHGTNSTLSKLRSSFLQANILGTSQDLCLSAIKLLESQSFIMTNETWQRLITPDVMSKIVEHYMKSFEETGNIACSLLLTISYFEWFTNVLPKNREVDWAKVTTSVNSTSLMKISEFLRDQIVFSNSMKDLQFWIEFTRGYLKELVLRPATTATGGDVPSNSLVGPKDSVDVLKEVLSWTLNRSTRARETGDGKVEDNHDLGDLEKIATESRRMAQNEDRNHGYYMEVQKFDFIPALSEQDWKEWIASIRLVLTGISLEEDLERSPSVDQ